MLSEEQCDVLNFLNFHTDVIFIGVKPSPGAFASAGLTHFFEPFPFDFDSPVTTECSEGPVSSLVFFLVQKKLLSLDLYFPCGTQIPSADAMISDITNPRSVVHG
jgi:hypothetical protein